MTIPQFESAFSWNSSQKGKCSFNKLASLEATLVRNSEWLTYSLTGVKCRATSVAKKLFLLWMPSLAFIFVIAGRWSWFSSRCNGDKCLSVNGDNPTVLIQVWSKDEMALARKMAKRSFSLITNYTRHGAMICNFVYQPLCGTSKHSGCFMCDKCDETCLSLIHIWRCRRIERCRSRWSPYH